MCEHKPNPPYPTFFLCIAAHSSRATSREDPVVPDGCEVAPRSVRTREGAAGLRTRAWVESTGTRQLRAALVPEHGETRAREFDSTSAVVN